MEENKTRMGELELFDFMDERLLLVSCLGCRSFSIINELRDGGCCIFELANPCKSV